LLTERGHGETDLLHTQQITSPLSACKLIQVRVFTIRAVQMTCVGEKKDNMKQNVHLTPEEVQAAYEMVEIVSLSTMSPRFPQKL